MVDHQKLRGGYYTPKQIADFLAAWAIQSPYATVLEPSCGDGNLLVSAIDVLAQLGANHETLGDQVVAIEVDQFEAEKAVNRIHELVPTSSLNVHVDDFFAFCQSTLFNQYFTPDKRFDAVIGNPPFIRYQNFPEEHRAIAFQIMEKVGFKPNRLTNAWLPFLIISTLLLSEHGRLAMVIPAELFQVSYAAEARRFLSDHFSKLTLLTFKKLVFDDIQQEVVLLLGEHNGHQETSLQVFELDNLDQLAAFDYKTASAPSKPMDHSSEKWTQYFLDPDEIILLRALRENSALTISGKVIDVDVGVVTGQNQFFILTDQKAKDQSLEHLTQRIVARSSHLQGAVFSETDWQHNLEADYSSHLFFPGNYPVEDLSRPAIEYIRQGEDEGVNTGYKCRVRNRWYVVPSVWIPDAFMLRQVHGYPKIILNSSGATCTDTIHRIRFVNGANSRAVTAAFLNSLTFAFAEVTGRSYGGGVLTFEPSEAENLPIPLHGAEQLDLEEIDCLLRKDDIASVLDITDNALLVHGLGLSKKEAKVIRGIWTKLRDRRINRKNK